MFAVVTATGSHPVAVYAALVVVPRLTSHRFAAGGTLGYARVSTGEQKPGAQRDRLLELTPQIWMLTQQLAGAEGWVFEDAELEADGYERFTTPRGATAWRKKPAF